jgi:hypothetical protein
MRAVLLLPVTASMLVVAGCGSNGRHEAAQSSSHRDLALVAQAPAVEIASPVELQQLRSYRSNTHRSVRAARPLPAKRSQAVRPELSTASLAATPATVLAVPAVYHPVPAADSHNDRELAPGKTVTVIPASSGPSTTADWPDEAARARGEATVGVHGGGTCRGGGRGPGIARAPRPDFR